VDGVTAALDQSQKPIQPPLSAWKARRDVGIKAELREAHDVCEIDFLKFFVVGDV
jgi:hypothetical protein